MPGAKVLGQANAHGVIEVTLKLRRKQTLPELEARPAVPLSRDELAARYGASQDDIDKVTQVMSGFGLNTVSSSVGARPVRLSGTISAIEYAFNVKLFNCVSSKLSYATKLEDFSVPELDFDIFANAAGNVFEWSFAEAS